MTTVDEPLQQRPVWAECLRSARKSRGWTQVRTIREIIRQTGQWLPEEFVDTYKRWERGRNKPSSFYRSLLVVVFPEIDRAIFEDDIAGCPLPGHEAVTALVDELQDRINLVRQVLATATPAASTPVAQGA